MISEHVTTVTATAALVSPWWLPMLEGVHTVASVALPIMGIAWLAMQMYYKYKEKNPTI